MKNMTCVRTEITKQYELTTEDIEAIIKEYYKMPVLDFNWHIGRGCLDSLTVISKEVKSD